MAVKLNESTPTREFQLRRGEVQRGTYIVQIARHDKTGWVGTGPRARAIVTNRRLILLPLAEHLSTASIPASMISRVWNIGLGKRDGLMFTLKSGQRVYMFVTWNQGSKMKRDTQELLALTPGESVQPFIEVDPLTSEPIMM